MKPKYHRLMYQVIEKGVEKGIHSLEHEDIESISEEQLVRAITVGVINQIHEWFTWEK
jgi:peptidoglycan/xylan/chitin deacetylase (PgdA/CDA1 family)|tara:strand:+ start:576 stop:749 length:174 start_codon:yes stop_codon:yes gene_type:complete